MKRINTYTSYAMALLSLLFVSSCSSDDEYTPGTPTPEDCQGAYFTDNNSESNVFENAEDVYTVTVEIGRTNTDEATVLPITVLSQSEGLTVPTSVTFAAGESLASMEIVLPSEHVVKGKSYTYELQLNDEDLDPYSSLGKGGYLKGNFSFPKDVLAKCYFSSGTFGNFKQYVKVLGDKHFYIENLMNSGYYLDLSADAEGKLTVSNDDYGYIDAYSGFSYLMFDWNSYTNDYDWQPFYPKGEEVYITKLEFYMVDTDFVGYNDWNAATRCATMCVKITLNTDNDTEYYPMNWDYLYIQLIDDEEEDNIDWD